jgi:hypothetical protein
MNASQEARATAGKRIDALKLILLVLKSLRYWLLQACGSTSSSYDHYRYATFQSLCQQTTSLHGRLLCLHIHSVRIIYFQHYGAHSHRCDPVIFLRNSMLSCRAVVARVLEQPYDEDATQSSHVNKCLVDRMI